MKATIFEIQRTSFVDGPGIRTTVFFKGCNMKCKWCHNPESQSLKPQIMFYKDKCTGCGRCKNITTDNSDFICYNDAKKICGREYDINEVFGEIIKDKPFYDNSGGGVTFSGGECMLQIDFLAEILKKCKENGINTAVDTAGNVPWDYFEKILPYTDLFLYDIKAYDNALHIAGTGVSNKKILENLVKLAPKSDIIIRIPIIGGYNDNAEEMKQIAEYLKPLHISKAELLPYHGMAKNKYEALNMKFTDYPPAEPVKIEKLRELFN